MRLAMIHPRPLQGRAPFAGALALCAAGCISFTPSASAPSATAATSSGQASSAQEEAAASEDLADFEVTARGAGNLSSFAPVVIASKGDDCHAIVVRLAADATFSSEGRLRVRWDRNPRQGDTPENGADVSVKGKEARAKLGCLLGKRSLPVALEPDLSTTGADGKPIVVPPGHGRYEVMVYSRKAAPGEQERERAARTKKASNEAAAQAARDRRFDRIEQIQHEMGCPDCRDDYAGCQAGKPPAAWRAQHMTCNQGFADCLKRRDVPPSDCKP